MDEQQHTDRPRNPRRKQRTQMQIFKETYLPAIIACAALLLIVTFIIGSIVRAVQRNKLEAQASLEASESEAYMQALLLKEAEELSVEAEKLALQFDYDGAISVIDSFSGDIQDFPALKKTRDDYLNAKNELVLWSDPGKIINLSFQLLIADPQRAFRDKTYGTSYNKNFITIDEFSKILQQLYDNNYILIGLNDFAEDGTLKDLYLPAGKKPLIITQTQVNYYTYMIDGDGDKQPDKNGAGFASRLIVDENGNLTCEMVDETGQTVTGAFDLVPILDAFVETHPDFSYKGQKAVLAVTGYDGIFGYRTQAKALSEFGQAYHNEQVTEVSEIVRLLGQTGYEIACYTYGNVSYGSYTPEQIKNDLKSWEDEVSPILGTVDTLVYARNSDISTGTAPYSGEKFTILQEYGFTRFLGFSTDGKPWLTEDAEYMRQGRLMVSGANLLNHKDWFTDLFDAESVLDATRDTIPS